MLLIVLKKQKTFLKLMINSVYGKIMANLQKRIKCQASK